MAQRTMLGGRVLARIYFGESDKHEDRPLETALLERLRKEGFAGATVFHGVAGFGARSVLPTHFLRLSQDLPTVVEVIDTNDKMADLQKVIDEMLSDAIVTFEDVRAMTYRSS